MITYRPASLPSWRLDSQNARVTAGLTWQPDVGPRAYARAANTTPKPIATPTVRW